MMHTLFGLYIDELEEMVANFAKEESVEEVIIQNIVTMFCYMQTMYCFLQILLEILKRLCLSRAKKR